MNLVASLSNFELIAGLDGLTHERLSATDETHLVLIDQHLDAYQREADRRVAQHTAGHGPNPHAAWWEGGRAVAQEIRERVPITYPLAVMGWRPARRTQKEQAGWCPFCQDGHDRFIVFLTGNDGAGRFWCRRCDLRGDVIDLYRWTQGNESFVRTVEHLAAVAGIPLQQPDDPTMTVVVNNAMRARHSEVA